MSGEIEKIIAKDGKKPNILMVIYDFKIAEERINNVNLDLSDLD